MNEDRDNEGTGDLEEAVVTIANPSFPDGTASQYDP